METVKYYRVGETDYEIYIAASGDYCVSVYSGKEREDYNLGTYVKALEFILRECELDNE